MFNKSDITRNEYMLVGGQAKCGYDWWWHSFTGRNEKTGEEKAFFIEFFLCNPYKWYPTLYNLVSCLDCFYALQSECSL